MIIIYKIIEWFVGDYNKSILIKLVSTRSYSSPVAGLQIAMVLS